MKWFRDDHNEQRVLLVCYLLLTTLNCLCSTDLLPRHSVGQKTGLFLRVDNFATVSVKKARDVKSFQISVYQDVQNYDDGEIKYSLHSLHKCSMHLNCAEFDNSAWILPNVSLKRTVKVTTTVTGTHIQTRQNSIWALLALITVTSLFTSWSIDRSVQCVLA